MAGLSSEQPPTPSRLDVFDESIESGPARAVRKFAALDLRNALQPLPVPSARNAGL
jgi:hypothetical protein